MRRASLLMAAFALAGCTANFNSPLGGAPERPGVACNGATIAVRACAAQAARSCANGYDVYDLGTGNRITDETSGIGTDRLGLITTSGARVVCKPASSG